MIPIRLRRRRLRRRRLRLRRVDSLSAALARPLLALPFPLSDELRALREPSDSSFRFDPLYSALALHDLVVLDQEFILSS